MLHDICCDMYLSDAQALNLRDHVFKNFLHIISTISVEKRLWLVLHAWVNYYILCIIL